MRIPLYQIDAFAGSVFTGNPAAVCPLDSWISDDLMQVIAMENNLSETAFFVPDGEHYHLRWFTPACEVELCGHATLASAYLVLTRLAPGRDDVLFNTLSGPLTVTREGDLLAMDFPARPAQPTEPCPGLLEALGGSPIAVLATQNYLVVYGSEEDVATLTPDMGGLKAVDRMAVNVTAPGTDCDFVSRYFAPRKGIDEDPVTGSAHCTLVPYWVERLGKAEFHARQVSQRGGELFCRARGDRVTVAGRAVLYMEGEISI
jgi:PhzF family phenazine biosynthesis protein